MSIYVYRSMNIFLLVVYSTTTTSLTLRHPWSQKTRTKTTLLYDREVILRNSRNDILIFFTTSASKAHIRYLKKCWPALMRTQLPILSKADILLHSNGAMHESDLKEIIAAFPNQVQRVVLHDNPGFQAGALQSMAQGVEKGWFENYKWVIRINPDVVILNEEPLLELMTNSNGNSTAGIFANCQSSCTALFHNHEKRKDVKTCVVRIHTDFYAFRPEYINKTAWKQWVNATNAENFATSVGFKNMLDQHLDAWLVPRNSDKNGACRVHTNFIIHQHSEQETGFDKCLSIVGKKS